MVTAKRKNSDMIFEDKVYQTYIDYEESNVSYQSCLEEYKKVEEFANENLKNLFYNVVTLSWNFLCKTREILDELTNFKSKLYEKSSQIISLALESTLQTNFEIIDYERNYFQAKNVEHVDIENFQFDSLDSAEKLNVYLCNLMQLYTFKRKTVGHFLKFLQEILKSNELLAYNSSKFQKTIYSFKNANFIYLQSTSIMHLSEFMKNLFDLFIKKMEEFSIKNQGALALIENLLKDFTAEENALVVNYNKFSKEFVTYKNNYLKQNANNANKDKLNISATTDMKYGKIPPLKGDEQYSEGMTDLDRKFSKFLTEFFEACFKSAQTPKQEKENQRFNLQLKEGIIESLMRQFGKIYSHLIEFLKFKSELPLTPQYDISNIFELFVKEYMTDSKFCHEVIKQVTDGEFSEVSIGENEFLVSRDDINTLKEYKIENILKDTDLIDIKEKAKAMKTNKNSNTPVKQEYPFNLKDDLLLGSFYCTLEKRSFYLHGRLYITSSRLVFYSWFNPTGSGRTLIEVEHNQVQELNKKGANLILKTEQNEVTLISISNVSKCVDLINEAKSQQNKIQTQRRSKANVLPHPQYKRNFLGVIDFLDQLKELNRKNYEQLVANNSIRTKFNATFVNHHKLFDESTNLGTPLCVVYKALYDPNKECDYFSMNKNFIKSQHSIRKDYDLTFDLTNFKDIPEYFFDPTWTVSLFTKFDEIKMKSLLDQFHSYRSAEYQYKYTHPMAKKTFMGPTKLNMHDIYNIIFVSPLCFIVELTTHCSGFMMMDSFYTLAQYKYETNLSYDESTRRVKHDTTLTVSFLIEFVKDVWFKNKIESNGLVENEEYVRTFVLENIIRSVEPESKEYYAQEEKLVPKVPEVEEQKEVFVERANGDYSPSKEKENSSEPRVKETKIEAIKIVNKLTSSNFNFYAFTSMGFLIFAVLMGATKNYFGDYAVYVCLFVLFILIMKVNNRISDVNQKLSKLI